MESREVGRLEGEEIGNSPHLLIPPSPQQFAEFNAMNETLAALQETFKTAVHYEVNGWLALFYTMWEQRAGVVCLLAFGLLLWKAPGAQQRWITGAGLIALVAAFLSAPPAPFLLTAMAVAGVVAVRIDRFNPDALRWRVVGGLTLYSSAALAYLAYSRYLAGIDAAAWAEAIGGQAEAQATLSQGRAFLNTLATWGLWLILPLGYLSLLVQSVLVHPPTESRPEETITAVRTRQES